MANQVNMLNTEGFKTVPCGTSQRKSIRRNSQIVKWPIAKSLKNTGCEGMVSQEYQGEFLRENVVENLNTIFSQHEWFSQK
jgi:hypothetical protein